MTNTFQIKRPDRDDVMTLAPALLVIILWYVVARRNQTAKLTMLLPAVAGIVLWVFLKGLRYVPR